MTIVFDDEEMYVALKAQAARQGRPAKDVVAEAMQEWLERKEDEALRQELDEARKEWREKGGVEAKTFLRASAKKARP
jgi:hypothetical protein